MELIKDQHSEDLAFRTRRFTRKLVRGLIVFSFAAAAYFGAMAFLELAEGTARSFMWFGIGCVVSLACSFVLSLFRV